jgi:hypothetical protein
MFESPSFSIRTMAMASPRTPTNRHTLLLDEAVRLFNQALLDGWIERVKAVLLRHPNQLLDLNDLHSPIEGRHASGMHTVPLACIRGTLGRADDFDLHFHPRSDRLRERWQSVAVQRLQGMPLAAVSLIQIGSCYGVVDGHHRISVAYALKQTEIDADITRWELSGPSVWEKPAFTAAPATSLTQLMHSRST